MSEPLMDLPEGKGPFKFVLQWHYRGKSVHSDLRLEVNDHLVGLTLDDPGGVGDKPRLSNNAEYSSAHKILAQPKARQPKEWLSITGEIPPGSVGATRFLPAKFETKDRGTYDMGAQKPHLFEVFLHGNKFDGRFMARKLPRSGAWEKAGKEALVWFFWKPIDQSPYVLSTRGISQFYTPPQGVSALPKDLEEKVPKDLRWWEKGFTGERALALIKEIRKLFLKREWLSAELRSSEFVLQKHWWKGQEVIRNMPVVHFDLRWTSGNKIDYFNLDGNPLEDSIMNGVKKSCEDIRWMSFEGEIFGQNIEKRKWLVDGNPNKEISAFVEQLDKGKLDIIEERSDFMSFKFHGNKLKGYWIAKTSDGEWTFQRSALPGQKREGFSNELTEKQVLEIAELSKKKEFSISDIAKEVGCSKSSIRYHLVRLGLK